MLPDLCYQSFTQQCTFTDLLLSNKTLEHRILRALCVCVCVLYVLYVLCVLFEIM